MEADEFAKGRGTTDIAAIKLWGSYPDEAKAMWLHNAFCANCGVTAFAKGYHLRKNKYGIVIEGTCKKCGQVIVRCCN